MFLFVSREDKDIVKVNYIEYVNIALERTVNIGLEGSRGISQTKGYNEKLEVIIVYTKGYFLLVSFVYLDSIVGIPQIDLREKGSTIKAVEKVVNK